IQTSSLSTDSNRSSICTGDDMNSIYSSALLRGPFIGYAKAITDCTPCPYYKDALPFKRGDTISIISKDESGTWIGMANGRVGHFKFVNVEEIRHHHPSGAVGRPANTKGIKLIIPITVEHQGVDTGAHHHHHHQHHHQHHQRLGTNHCNDNHSNASVCDGHQCNGECNVINDRLKSVLMDSQTAGADGRPLTLADIKQAIGLSDLHLNLLTIYGYSDPKLLARVVNEDRLNECGISDRCAQHRLLNAARLLRHHYHNLVTSDDNQSTIGPPSTSQQPLQHHKYVPKHQRPRVSVSAPTTPAITPSIDFTSDEFTQLISKLESVSTSSLENSCSYDDHHLKHQLVMTTGAAGGVADANSRAISARTAKSDKKRCNSGTHYTNIDIIAANNERIYENNEQIISATLDRHHSSSLV
ncbi:unnamed protein product, partial [Medioppia subpectinata]